MLAAAMQRLGHEVLLVPLYTPITTDEKNVSSGKLFFGGLNVYLQQKFAIFRHLPRAIDRALDHPRLVSLLATLPSSTNQINLADLTLSMVRGEHGHQRKEVWRLVDWLAHEPRIDIIHLSNLLIGGCAPILKEKLSVPIVVTLQGDDVFLDALPEPTRSEILAEMQELAKGVDRFIVHSRFYAEKMANYFNIPADRFSEVPLGIEESGYLHSREADNSSHPARIGYLARICPAKGLHLLIDAYLELKRQEPYQHIELWVAGDLNEADQSYFQAQKERIRRAGYQADVHFVGRLSHEQKIAFLRQLDLFSVPALYPDPKGRYVLEALASGLPVVQPAHGAFPEMLARTGGGRLFAPGDPDALVAALAELLTDHKARKMLAREGPEGVVATARAEHSAAATLNIYARLLGLSGG